jgi:uncharacterized coiled-coil DUF342 family protein
MRKLLLSFLLLFLCVGYASPNNMEKFEEIAVKDRLWGRYARFKRAEEIPELKFTAAQKIEWNKAVESADYLLGEAEKLDKKNNNLFVKHLERQEKIDRLSDQAEELFKKAQKELEPTDEYKKLEKEIETESARIRKEVEQIQESAKPIEKDIEKIREKIESLNMELWKAEEEGSTEKVERIKGELVSLKITMRSERDRANRIYRESMKKSGEGWALFEKKANFIKKHAEKNPEFVRLNTELERLKQEDKREAPAEKIGEYRNFLNNYRYARDDIEFLFKKITAKPGEEIKRERRMY